MARKAFGLANVDPQVQKDLRALASLLRVADKAVLKSWRTRAYNEIERPLAAEAAALYRTTSKYPSVGNVVKARRGGTNMAIVLGAGSSTAAERALGTEFGGQKGRKVTYLKRSRTGRSRHWTTRRTTMQFWPHKGRDGYVLIPLMRRSMSETVEKTVDIVMDELKKLPGANETRVL